MKRKRMLKRLEIRIGIEAMMLFVCAVCWFLSYYVCFESGKWISAVLGAVFAYHGIALDNIREEIANGIR